MFNLESLSKKKLLILSIVHWIVYIGLCVIAPCVTILVKYSLVGEKVKVISGIGICILLIFSVVGLGIIKKLVRKIPIDAYLWQARLKAILDFVSAIIIPIICLILIVLIKDDMELATATIKAVVWFFIFGFTEQLLLGSSVDRENEIRNNAKRVKEQKRREALV